MRTLHVVAAAISRGEEVLAALRGPTMSLPDVWEFPGGKVEPGERPPESLVREIEEELGVTINVGGLLARGDAVVGDRRIVLDVYRCELVDGTPHAREHAELRWVHRSRLDELEWAEADLPAVAALRADAT